VRDPETGEMLRNRDVSRHDFFDQIEFGVYEIPITVLLAFVLTVALILFAKVMARAPRV